MTDFAFEKTRIIQLNMKPSVGRIVHYVSYGTPGGEYGSECRAAIVTATDSTDDGFAALCVLNPSGFFFVPSEQDESDHHAGTWHWPERVGG